MPEMLLLKLQQLAAGERRGGRPAIERGQLAAQRRSRFIRPIASRSRRR